LIERKVNIMFAEPPNDHLKLSNIRRVADYPDDFDAARGIFFWCIIAAAIAVALVYVLL